ncbi:hypothetical protein E8E14_008365 [Neopestalotiopsis sp. 37M]|nr:hypothetical protein E8E14_008365 [Neopestalotiopsis sp. 37M]
MAIEDFLRPLHLDVATVHQLSHEYHQTFRSLAAESQDQFLPTPITESILRPTAGSEKGRYLAIDIGGSNLRVGFVELLGDDRETATPFGVNGVAQKHQNGHQNGDSESPRLRRVLEKSWPILEHFKNEAEDALFAWIGACIAEVVQDGCKHYDISADSTLPLGVTFSFPMVQSTLSQATLMAMGKGFAISSNLDLGSQLLKGYETATQALSLPSIEVVAIANDSVSTLVSFIYQSHETSSRKASMGLICGTGCNATIALRKDMLHPNKLPVKVGLSAQEDHDDQIKIAVNTELSINGSAPALHKFGLVSEWDKRLDAEGDKPGFQPLEYMTAGRYLGELGRLILVDYLERELGHYLDSLPASLLKRFSMTTTFLSHFRPPHAPELLGKLEAEFPAIDTRFQWTEDIALAVYTIAKTIELRAAGIIAAATIGLLACAGDLPFEPLQDRTNQSNGHVQPTELIVGYTGGCIEHFQDYLTDCQDFLDRAIEVEFGKEAPVRVLLSPCHDGGIKGAGVLAGCSTAKPALRG